MKFCTCLLALAMFTSAPALAQSSPASPGTVDSVKAATGSRNDSSNYNSVVGHLGNRGTKGRAAPAAASDLLAGRPLRDIKGEPIARIEAVDSEGVIVAAGTTRVRLPLNAFGKDEMGLLLGITAAEFRSLVANVTTADSGG